jgi:hypothetical protein
MDGHAIMEIASHLPQETSLASETPGLSLAE